MAKLLKNSDAKLKGLMSHSMLASYRIRSLAIYVVIIKGGIPMNLIDKTLYTWHLMKSRHYEALINDCLSTSLKKSLE